jgi:hypothetical protein
MTVARQHSSDARALCASVSSPSYHVVALVGTNSGLGVELISGDEGLFGTMFSPHNFIESLLF